MSYITFYKSHNPLCTTNVVYHVQKVQAVPISLAATFGIIRLFSFRPVTKMFQFTGFPSLELCIGSRILRYEPQRVSPFGIPRIKVIQQLPQDYRSFTRPSSAGNAKASPISSLQLYLILYLILRFDTQQLSLMITLYHSCYFNNSLSKYLIYAYNLMQFSMYSSMYLTIH